MIQLVRPPLRNGHLSLHRCRGLDEAPARAGRRAVRGCARRTPPDRARGVGYARRRRGRHAGGRTSRSRSSSRPRGRRRSPRRRSWGALSSRLDLLRGGHDADPRQQTLRAAIEWSYDLLTPEEQRLFRSLSVFAGGCTLEAAEEVADADLDTLHSLVEKRVLRFTSERYWMLETIREYAGERLETRRLRKRGLPR